MRSKKKFILTIAFIISLSPMILNQYGGFRGVQEITGMINLTNPIGIIALITYFIGVWGQFKKKSKGKILGLIGVVGIVISEIYTFFTWHVLTITGEINLQHSVALVFPEFYVGLTTSIMMIIAYVIIHIAIKDLD